MNKPFSIVYEEFKQELANLINNSSLPLFIIESILKDVQLEVRGIAQKQYRMDLAEYEKFIAEQKISDEKTE